MISWRLVYPQEATEEILSQQAQDNPLEFGLKQFGITGALGTLLWPLEALALKLLALDDLAEGYSNLHKQGLALAQDSAAQSSVAGTAENPSCSAEQFVRLILEELDIDYSLYPGIIEDRIPKTGPLVVVSNHPFGALEAMILAEVVRKVRPDAKFMANFLLERIPELKELFILVDPFEGESSSKRNIAPLREAMRWLKDGHVLLTFPAGTVSHLQLNKREVQDPAWSENIAKLVRKSKANVLPVFVHGRNDFVFQIAGLIHPLVRTALLVRQLFNKRGKHIKIQLGKTLPFHKLERFDTDKELIDYLRLRSYIQKNSKVGDSLYDSESAPLESSEPKVETDIADRENSEVIQQEIEALPQERLLIQEKGYLVAYALASEIPVLLREIGRCREEAFRKVGEGTGQERDLDWFDNYYTHLFCWNREKNDLVGAYRIARTDEVVKVYGLKGLYTYSLFRYSTHLLEQLGPSLEMGRSFVRPNYQRNFWSLLSLWRGIGSYVAQNPRYKTLFGPVSISDSFDSLSRQLMTVFLKSNNYESTLAQFVKPRTHGESARLKGVDQQALTRVVKDLSEVSELISDIELREEQVPILLREYVKLGGKLIGFSVDPNFSSVLDGLIVVDMTQAKPNILKRYMGKQAAEEFMEFHKNNKNHQAA